MTAPVFVTKFADGETTRMTTHCASEKLDWGRGRNLAKHAWQTRDRRRRIEKFLASHDRNEHRHELEEFLGNIEERPPPEITSCHFDVDGQVVREPSESAPAR
jgi:hypothetical protein